MTSLSSEPTRFSSAANWKNHRVDVDGCSPVEKIAKRVNKIRGKTFKAEPKKGRARTGMRLAPNSKFFTKDFFHLLLVFDLKRYRTDGSDSRRANFAFSKVFAMNYRHFHARLRSNWYRTKTVRLRNGDDFRKAFIPRKNRIKSFKSKSE